jgi:glutamate synthase (NADPH/NADH) large chain
MTGGLAVILGPVGDNFGAGMTGGMAYVLDEAGDFEIRANSETIVMQALDSEYYEEQLMSLIREHIAQTGSQRATEIMRNWQDVRGKFVQICPKEMLSRIKHPLSDTRGKASA